MKKNVCFIISGTGYSGAEIVLNRYLENNDIINPSFLIIFKNSEMEKLYKSIYGENKVNSLNINYNKNIYRFTIPLYINFINSKLKTYFKSNNVDAIYVNNTSEGILCSKFIKYTNIKSILHIHDMRKCYTHPYNNYIINNYFKSYDKIITVSNATKESWNQLEMEVVYNGLKEEYFSSVKKIEAVNDIAFIGSLNQRKGADYLIDSLENLLERTEINITFVFRDYDKKLLEKLEKIKSSRINILRNLNESQIKEVYNNIDLVVVPSRFDPLPTVIMEAESQGKLVLGNKSSGIPEMINITELLVDISSAKDLEEAVCKVIKFDKVKINKYQELLYDYSKDKFKSNYKKEKVNEIINKLIVKE